MQTIKQLNLKTVSIFSILYMLFPVHSHADFEPAHFDSSSWVLMLPKLTIDSSQWLANTEVELNFSTGQFAVHTAGNSIAAIDTSNTSAFFSTSTQLLVIPSLVTNDSLWFEEVQLQFDFASARFSLLNAKAVSAPFDQREVLHATCIDTFAKTSCCADPFNAPCNESSQFSFSLNGETVIWKYTSEASCSSAYPEYEYNPYAGLKEKCKLLGWECGACAILTVKD